MPGHEKKKKNADGDPDPSEYLIVSMDMKREDQAKPYDTKKSFWVPDGQGGYLESMLESNDGKVAKVIVKGYEVNSILFWGKFNFTIFLFVCQLGIRMLYDNIAKSWGRL